MLSELPRFEVKCQPAAIPETKIVEAYGLQKCRKLSEQVAGDDLDVRVNALTVLCDEFRNPYSIYGCIQAGLIKVLACMVSDPDFITREKASKALAIAATDANGLEAILNDDAVPDILCGKSDLSPRVRGNVYECLFQLTRTTSGVNACVQSGVTEVFCSAISTELLPLKPTLLKALHNIVGSREGLRVALESRAVATCIDLLNYSTNPELMHLFDHSHEGGGGGTGGGSRGSGGGEEDTLERQELKLNIAHTVAQAARTLSFLCFDEVGKEDALACGVVGPLCHILSDLKQSRMIKSAILNALMAITTTDEGKRQVHVHSGTNHVIAILYEDDKVVRLNALKVISNIAVYPPIRKTLIEDITCVSMLKRIRGLEDPLLTKHAEVALKVVHWTP